MPAARLSDALTSLWTGPDAAARRRTLARLAQHQRQLESWWKCELAAHLWDHVAGFGPDIDVFIESHDRADLTIATAATSPKGVSVAPEGAVCIPIELKTTGTWWGSSPSAVAKALSETGKKRLTADMADARNRRRSRPFAAVGLLVTHIGDAGDAEIASYVDAAKELGRQYKLNLLVDDAIPLAPEAGQAVAAHQVFWTS